MLMKSYKTELQLTALVNNSEHIKWWSSAQSFNWVSVTEFIFHNNRINLTKNLEAIIDIHFINVLILSVIFFPLKALLVPGGKLDTVLPGFVDRHLNQCSAAVKRVHDHEILI